ncbi:MAG: molybdate ABC transporter substrate-binding protein [Pseudomonadota bacterium]
MLLPLPSLADTLRVAVASNFVPVVEKLAPVFESESGHSIAIIGGATGQHYTQIVNGAPFDVFLSADEERPRLLENNGQAVAGSRMTYAIGQLVLWSPNAGIVDTAGAVLKDGTFNHLAIASPQLAPYGAAALQVLTGMGVWDAVEARLVQGQNITQTLQFIETGNAELGFIAYSQWIEIDPDRKGSAWEVPASLHDPINQGAVILKDSAAARAFFSFLQSDSSKAFISAAGYGVP